MSKTLSYRILGVVILALLAKIPFYAQEQHSQSFSEKVAQCQEKLHVFTDRSYYAVHEKIRFSAFIQTDAYPNNAPESSVLYVELINPLGSSMAQGKYRIFEKECRASLSIPGNILSGTYYLKVYTRWMRNFGAESFSYLPLTIVNPFQSELAPISDTGSARQLIHPEPEPGGIHVFMEQDVYQIGEDIKVECSFVEELNMAVPFASLTVVPEGAIDTPGLPYRIQVDKEAGKAYDLRFLPDFGGITLSGKVTKKGRDEGVSGVNVLFSMKGEEAAFFAGNSDSLGQFFVKIPTRFSINEVFVAPQEREGEATDIHIARDFDTEPLSFKQGSLQLNEKERVLGSRIALHMQLERAFRAKSEVSGNTGSELTVLNSFYGEPEISVTVGEFINLPSVEEIIENLVPSSFVKQEKGVKYIYIESENPMISFYKPLILVDNIPVFDPETVLAIPPSRIKRIEVVPEVYVLGNTRFGGIISFISINGDMAGIRPPENSYYFDYACFQAPDSLSGTRLEEMGQIPDTRNTIFWSDRAALNAGKSYHAEFKGPSIPGNYVILYRGISSNGKFVNGISRFKTIQSDNPDSLQQ